MLFVTLLAAILLTRWNVLSVPSVALLQPVANKIRTKFCRQYFAAVVKAEESLNFTLMLEFVLQVSEDQNDDCWSCTAGYCESLTLIIPTLLDE